MGHEGSGLRWQSYGRRVWDTLGIRFCTEPEVQVAVDPYRDIDPNTVRLHGWPHRWPGGSLLG